MPSCEIKGFVDRFNAEQVTKLLGACTTRCANLSSQSIDDPPPGENASAHGAKSAAFALASLTQTSVAFAEYVRVDKTRAAPVLDDATLRVASVSLAKMALALA